MNSGLIFNSINMILDMNKSQYNKPEAARDQVDAFQQIFVEEVFSKTIMDGYDNNSQDDITGESDGIYSSVIAKQLMTRLLTDQLVKQDALHIRKIVLGSMKNSV